MKFTEKDLRKIIREEVQKAVDKKVTKGKDIEQPKVTRTETKEDKTELNTQAKAQDKNLGTTMPTDKEWKELRTAKEVQSSVDDKKIIESQLKLFGQLPKDIDKLYEIAEAFDPEGVMCNKLKEALKIHDNYWEVKPYKFRNVREALGAVAVRMRSLAPYRTELKTEMKEMGHLLLKYLKVDEEIINYQKPDQKFTDTKKEKIKEGSRGNYWGHSDSRFYNCEECGNRIDQDNQEHEDDSNPVCDDCREEWPECSVCKKEKAIPTDDGKPPICSYCYDKSKKNALSERISKRIK